MTWSQGLDAALETAPVDVNAKGVFLGTRC